MKKNFQRKGFTIIETSLVIAIGGLILLMVFVALPALQRSQRDTSRRESVNKLITEIKNYQINNRGLLPALSNHSSGGEYIAWSAGASTNSDSWSSFYGVYLGDNFVDPDGERYGLHVVSCDTTVAYAESGNGAASSEDSNSGRATDGSKVTGTGRADTGKDTSSTSGRVLDAECAVTATGGAANVSGQSFPNDYNMSVVIGAVCNGTRAVASANPRMVAVLYKLEGAGEYCANT